MKPISTLHARLSLLAFLWALVQSVAAQNFTMTLQPDTVTLVPGQASSFIVSMTPLNGFTNTVTLSTGTLPNGVTATFSPNPVTLSGSSLLTLNATTNATLGTFTLNISGVGGGITNTTSSSVTVNFGLLPLCYGAFTGEVTDAQTGLPVPGATVEASYTFAFFDNTSAQGIYNFTNLPLGLNNAPAFYNLRSTAPNYWFASTNEYAVCDATNSVNLAMVAQQFGSISGNVTIQGGGPAGGVNVQISGPNITVFAVTDTNGNYKGTNLGLNYTNAPAFYSVSIQPAGDWQATSNTTVQANSNSVVNLVLIPICHVTVKGTVFYGDTLLPTTNGSVTVFGGNGGTSTITDSSGNYTATNIALGFDNVPTTGSVQASAPGYFTSFTNISLSNCGSTNFEPSIFLVPIPKNNFASVMGHVFDITTGLPIAGALIQSGAAVTDSNGFYLYTNILIGSGSVTNVTIGLSSFASGYFQSFSNVVLDAGLTNTQDFRLLKEGFGFVIGTVRDSATTLPLTNIFVSFSGIGSVTTDSNGAYVSPPIPLTTGNAPTAVTVFTTPNGYYQYFTNTTVTNGLTNIVNLAPIKVCTGATIVGNVVNAINQQPITNATVFVSGFPSKTTDTNGNFILTNITVGNLNSPIQVTVNASAPGFNPQSHNVTIFCNATITTEFGAPQTAFGTIQGLVTNFVTGAPLAGAFIGSEFGEATTTDTNGFYVLSQAPLGANNSSRTWTVTAIPTNFQAQTLSVTVSSNAISTLNFGFGQPPTHLLLTESSTTNTVTVGSNLVYTITLFNAGADAANVQLTDLLAPTLTYAGSSITNPPGGTFTSPVFSNGIITTGATNFGSNQTLVLVVTTTPTVAGLITNITTVTSSTPDTDPTGTNRTAQVVNTAVAPASLHADLGLTMRAQPNPVMLSNQLVYFLTVTNSGPADAPDVVLDDPLPFGELFVSASNSQGTFILTALALTWDLGPIANHGSADVSIVVTPQTAGLITNIAMVAIGSGGAVTDTNPANDSAAVVTTVSAPALTNVSVQALGPITFNPQTGLFEQTVQFQNLSSNAATAVRVSVLGLPANIVLYNASGSSSGVPFVEYDLPVAAGGSVNFLLEYYEASRKAFTSTNFSATAVVATSPVAPGGTILQLDQTPTLHNGVVLIEFTSTPGATYVIEYSSDTINWNVAVPPIKAAGTRTQWLDSGPPKTASMPTTVGQRYYRVVQTSPAP